VTAQKTPLSRTLSLYVDGMIRKEIDKLGRALPCQVVSVDGAVVTVSFQIAGVQIPQVEMPLFGPEYIRYPIQANDLGVCFPVDTYIGQVSGLGSGQASLTRRANLSTLVFFPIGNANWSAVDPDAVTIYGPNGVVLRDSDSKTVVTLTPDGVDVNAQHNVTVEADTEIQATVGSNSVLINTTEIVLTVGAATLTMNASGITSTVPITAPSLTGSTSVSAGTSLKVAGKEMSGHEHHVSGIQTGSSTVTTSAPI
jgi:hypothetical protein